MGVPGTNVSFFLLFARDGANRRGGRDSLGHVGIRSMQFNWGGGCLMSLPGWVVVAVS